MSNEVLYIGTMLVAFVVTVAAYRFGKVWLNSWLAASMVLSIASASVIVDVFGFAVNAGMTLYVGAFLATDMLSERYGKQAARTSVYITTAVAALYFVFTQLIVLLAPEAYSTEVYDALSTVFGTTARVALAAIVSYLIAQHIDIAIYQGLKALTRGKYLWLRNNVSTITTQSLDNLLFFVIAFYGILPNWFELVVTATIFRIGVSLLDTPFVYLARYITPRDVVEV